MEPFKNIVSLINLLEKKENTKFDLQVIISGVNSAVVDIEEELSNIKSHYGKCQMRLCLLQMENVLSGISELLTHSIITNFSDILALFINKLTICMKQVLDILKGVFSLSDEDTFLTLMEKIKGLLNSPDTGFDNLQPLVDDLLCHALTIAKLSNSLGYKEITASCKNVLSAISAVYEGGTYSDGEYMNSYLICQLETLERKVNSSMLHLLLEVMVSPLDPLREIVDLCMSDTKDIRKPVDVDSYIVKLDLNCERIHLIGNFAILATEDSKIRVSLQNCLANMEFWEESLVPASINYYMNPDSNEKKEIVRFIAREWKKDVAHLNILLHSVVDPANLSLVAFENLTDIVNDINNGDKEAKIILYKCIYQRSKKVIEHVLNSPEDLLKQDEIVSETVEKLEKELTKIKAFLLAASSNNSSVSLVDNTETILSLMDQLSQRLSCILLPQGSASISGDTLQKGEQESQISLNDTVKEIKMGGEILNPTAVPSTSVVCKGNLTLEKHMNKAIGMSPFTPTMYQKKRRKKGFALEISTILDSNC